MHWRLKSTIQEIFMSQRSVCNTSECIHSFSSWEVFISVRLLCGLSGARGWDAVSVVCWVLSKGWFPYDRGSQIAIRSAIVCDHMETTSAILRSWSQTIAEDRTMLYLKASFHMIADDRRSQIANNRNWSQEIEHGSIFCDRLRSRSQDRRRSQK